MNFPELPRSAEIKTDVLETPVTRDVMDATLPDGLDQDIIDGFHDAAMQGKPYVGYRLQKFIKRFPSVPCLKNYLVVAFTVQGKREEAVKATEMLLDAHPDYLFGRAMAAVLRMRVGRLEEARALLGPSLRLRDLYPQVAMFHMSEVKAYYHAVGMYHLEAGNHQDCLAILAALQQLLPDSAEVKSLLREISIKHQHRMQERMDKSDRAAIRVREAPIPREDYPDDTSSFLHGEIYWLYNYGYNLPPEMISALLALPRETLVADLQAMLKDAIRVGPSIHWERKAFGCDDAFSGPLNALHFLAELKATETIGTILDFFSQHSELMEIWLGEMSFGDLLYPYAVASPARLADWMKQPGLSAMSREGVADAFAKLALREPSRHAEVIAWFTDVLEFLVASPPADNILDTELVSAMVWNLCDMRAVETLPLIRTLYDHNLVSESQVGTYDEVAQDICEPIGARKQLPMQSLQQYYRKQSAPLTPPSILRGGIESLLDRPVAKQQPVDLMTGRNDACPCGSGRKFKKCCMR